MSRNNTETMQKLVSAFIIWCMVAVSIMGLFTVGVGGADLQKPVPHFVPSIIDNETFEIRDWGVYDADFSITVQNGGTLRVVNSTLNFLQDVNTTYFIDVNSNSSLELENSTITTAASPRAMWDPVFEITIVNSTFKMEDHSVLAFPGWLNVTNSRTYINDSWITGAYPETLSTAYADDFPTFKGVVTPWWLTTPWAPSDAEDDAPRMIFRDCDNVTISDSRIEKLYEDEDLEVPVSFNVTYSPSVAATTPAPVGNVSYLVNQDLIYMNVSAGLTPQSLTIDSFNVPGTYSSTDYQINNVWVHALYNTSLNGISGYNGTDYVEWRVDGGIYANLFMLAHNSPPWAENYSIPLTPVPSFTDIANLDIRFNNTYPNGVGVVLFDQIEIIAELQRVYDVTPTMITIDNTEMTVINSYVGVDWLNATGDFTLKNGFDLSNGANLYLFNVSISEDETGLPGKADYLEIPVRSDPADYVPFRQEPGCEVYYFKWAEVPVIDRYSAPVQGAYVNATFHFTEQSKINNISKINDLSGDTRPNWKYSKQRMIDYLARTRGIAGTAFNVTGIDGRALIPLLTTYFNASNYPNGDHVGEYDIKVNYTGASGSGLKYAVCDFNPYPVSQPADNTVTLDTVVMDGVTLPRPFGSPGLIVNATTGNMAMDGGASQELAITDFIIVEDTSVLTLTNVDLLMSYTDSAPFQIIVRDRGELRMSNVVLSTLNNRLINVYVEDNATLTMTDCTSPGQFHYLASGNAVVSFTNTDINGDFDVTDATAAVRLFANNTMFSRNLDDFSGDSRAILRGCYSPLSPNFKIMPSENAKVWIYRNIDVTVYDGVIPANPLENVNVWVTNTNPIAAAYDLTGQTGADGHYRGTGLSDYIYYNPPTDEIVESHYNLYSLRTQYQPFAINHDETTGMGLAAYPAMALNDAGKEMTVVLEKVLPDLDPPMNIWVLDNNTIGRGDTVHIGTVVSNTGDATANNIDVWFNDSFAMSDVIYFETIDTLAPGESRNISFEYVWESVSDIGQHNISVTIDPLNYILEQNESNNDNWTLVNVTSQPDLSIGYYDVTISETYPLINQAFNINVAVWNLGDINASNVVVSIYDNNGLLGNVTVANIPPSQTVPVTASLSVTYAAAGTYYIYVAVDEANLISEVDETNNNNSGVEKMVVVWDNPDLNIDVLDVIVGTDLVEYNLGGGVPVTSCNFRTEVTLRARVWNIGELFAQNVQVQFWDGTASLGTSSIVSSITSGNYAYMMITWEATSAGLQQVHDLSAVAYGTGLTSNTAAQTLTVYDNRADLEMVNIGLAQGTAAEIVDSEAFDVNITLTNNGMLPAENFGLEIYASESDYQNTSILHDSGFSTYMGRLGNMTVAALASGITMNYTITCNGLPEGTYTLYAVVDGDYNSTDVITVLGTDYNIVGSVEEYDETNNNGTLTITVIMPDLMVRLVIPAMPDNSWPPGGTSEILVTGNVVRTDNTDQGIAGINVTIEITDSSGAIVGTPITVPSGQGGLFTIGMQAPDTPDNYTVTVSGANGASNIASATSWFIIQEPGLNLMLWIIIIIIIVVAVIVGITLYLYFVGLGKTVQCGECGAFIPEGASKCPKCGVEFEDEVAKCSVCGAWVPIDVKNCPECGTEFTVGTEDLDDYEAKMKRQYDDIVRKFKQDAKADLGDEFTETEFQAWWAVQPSFITFDQWLQEEEEMKRMGSKPCHNCGTENSVTAKICHKCGTVLETEEEPKPKKPEGKLPAGKKPAEVPPKEAAKPEPASGAAPAPEEEKPPQTDGKKNCPSCGMEVGVNEKTCPICNYEFEKPSGGEPPKETPPPSGGDGTAPVKRVVRKPVKRVVKRPVQKGGQ